MNTLYQKIDKIAGKYNLSPCAVPGPHHNADVAWIKTDDWPEEALAELAHVAAKRFSPRATVMWPANPSIPRRPLCNVALIRIFDITDNKVDALKAVTPSPSSPLAEKIC